METKTIYLISADYGGMENWFEAAFTNEADRNEIALAVAEEVEWCNFNLNIIAWMNMGFNEEEAIKFALSAHNPWERANEAITTWEVPLYG